MAQPKDVRGARAALSKEKFKLGAETKDRLDNMGPDLEKARHAISVLKDFGMSTKDIEEKLAWAENVRETLLKEFT